MSITIKAFVENNVNFAAVHGTVKLINKVSIQANESKKVICRIISVPEIIYEYKKEMTLSVGENTLEDIDIIYNDGFYRQELIEARDGEIKVELLDSEEPEKILAFANYTIHIQPYLHWNRSEYPYTLPAFMQPNDPLVASVLEKAGEIANKAGDRMCGYQGGTKDSVIKQAKYIYEALQAGNLHYISSPASFEETGGQKIRIPHQVLHEQSKMGTCLDLAILYATCLEAARINSVIIVISGHAFTAVWLQKEKTLDKFYEENGQAVAANKSASSGSLMPVECTAFTDKIPCSFEEAVAIGNKNIDATIFAVDVLRSRMVGIKPVYTYTDQAICTKEDSKDESKEDSKKDKTVIPEQEEPEHTYFTEQTEEHLTKIERLKKQAMDISTRNTLLAEKNNRLQIAFSISTEKFLCGEYSDESLYRHMKKEVLSEGVKEEELEECFAKMRMLDREQREEKGEGNLYLTLNHICWKRKDENRIYRAPLYLCPVEIYKNKRGEHLFRCNPEKIQFNYVLKELLIQDYSIDIFDLMDDPKEEYREQMKILRYRIEKQKKWSIEEDKAVITACQIPNEAVWNQLSNENVLKHDVVAGILNGSMTWENDIESDSEPENEDTVYVYQADSSQSRVIAGAGTKKAQLVIGPAGNGKTQTIANIVTNEMRQGNNVLFISEKLSALEVVTEMLAKKGFAPFCLQVIEGKQNSKDVARQVENSLRYLEQYEGLTQKSDSEKYMEAAEKIQKFYATMNQKDVLCGKSLTELIEERERYSHIQLKLNWEKARTAINSKESENVMELFAEVAKKYGTIQSKYLPYIRACSPDLEDEAEQKIDKALEAMQQTELLSKQVADLLEISTENMSTKQQLKDMIKYASVLRNCPIIAEDVDYLMEKVEIEQEKGREELWDYFEEMKDSSPNTRRHIKAKKMLVEKLAKGLNKAEAKKLESEVNLDKFEERIRNYDVLQFSFDRGEMFDNKFELLADYKKTLSRIQEQGQTEVFTKLTVAAKKIASGEKTELQSVSDALVRKYKEYTHFQEEAGKLVLQNLDEFAVNYPDVLKVVLFEEWKENRYLAGKRQNYQNIKKKAENAGLGSIVEQMEKGMENERLNPEEIMDAYKKCWYDYNIQKIRTQHPELAEFDHILYTVSLRQYSGEEEELRQALRKNLIYQQVSRLPRIDEGVENNPELGKLNKLVRRKGKTVSTRTLFEQAPNILMDLYPCMIMNSTAVAEYLPSEVMKFDLVIIDEGSQMPTYKALYPISLGERCMIFGDEKQLTPTSVFQKNLEEEDGFSSPMESIIEDAIATSMPKKMLKYHYRSENESLIAFSNAKYYNGEIVSFPSNDTNVCGVKYIPVENSVYDRGGKKTNEIEAKRVLELIKEIYQELPDDTKETLGVITLNIPQRNLIQSMLIKEYAKDEVLGKKADDLVSVVNLEACQGKEWSYVIISPGYGVDEKGEFSLNLGAISRNDGGNRLNVMVSRARKKMYVVSGLKPEMLVGAQAEGTKDFRDFLSYARGELALDTRETEDKDSKGSMITSVATALRKKGYTVHTNIGSSKCKVDIGVVSPEDPDKYVLGILLDHFSEAKYHIKDREIICPSVLKEKGWNIYRLHSVDWYENPRDELQQMLDCIK